MSSKNSIEEKIRTILLLLILAIVVLGQIFPKHITQISGWLTSLAVGAILSVLAGGIIEGFSGDYLKGKFMVIKLFGINFSVSLFVISVLIFKFLFFR